MKYIEYLEVFSNQGPIKVSVNFKDSKASIASRKMQPGEISKLIDPNMGDFYREMRFDDWLATINKVVLCLEKNTLVIYATFQ